MRRRRLRLAAAVGGVVVLIALIVLAWQVGSRPSPAESPQSSVAGSGASAVTPTASLTSAPAGQTPHRSSTTARSGTGAAAPNAGAATQTPSGAGAPPGAGAPTTRSPSTSVSPQTTARPATTTPPTTGSKTKPASTTATPKATKTGKVVVIDPGHQRKGNPAPEPIGPGASQTKPKVSSGTAGVATGIPESELVLAVSLKLRDALQAAGVRVVMTRTTQDVDLSNIQRAQIANQAEADLFVRVHADGASDPSVHGIHVLYPASIKGWTDDIAVASKRAASLAQRELVAATGAKDRGIDARSDMAGFNWSDVPAIIPEIGFMSNPAEDRRLATDSYRNAIVAGLTKAILLFLEEG